MLLAVVADDRCPARAECVDACDAALVAYTQCGNIAAFDVLVKRYRKRVFSILYHLTGNREDASDLAQDTFIIAFRSIGKFRRSARFYTWIYRIAVNLAMRHLRRRRFRQFFNFENIKLDSESEEFISELDFKMSGDKKLLLKELQLQIAEAMEKLSIAHRIVVILAEIDGLSTEEIAVITKTSEGTIRSRLHYAKCRLKASLQRYLGK